MTNIAGSGSESGTISQRHGSEDPDPDQPQNVMDPQHCPLLWELLITIDYGCGPGTITGTVTKYGPASATLLQRLWSGDFDPDNSDRNRNITCTFTQIFTPSNNGWTLSVANPDPGSGGFFTTGSWIRIGQKIRIQIRDEKPGPSFWELKNNLFKYLNSFIWIWDGKKSDPGSRINIPDPQHCIHRTHI